MESFLKRKVGIRRKMEDERNKMTMKSMEEEDMAILEEWSKSPAAHQMMSSTIGWTMKGKQYE